MSGDDLQITLFIYGAALAVALTAVQSAGSVRRWMLMGLWGLTGALFLLALFWRQLGEAIPLVQRVLISASPIGLYLMGAGVLGLLFADHRNRKKLFHSKPQSESPKEATLALPTPAADMLTTKTLIEHQNGIHRVRREIPVMRTIQIEHMAISLLFDGLPEPPQLTENWASLNPTFIEAERTLADGYYKTIRSTLASTQWDMDLRAIGTDADAYGEAFVRDMPHEQRPKGVDPLDLRRYAIARLRCSETARFIDRARGEAKFNLRGFLFRLKDEAKAQGDD